jgi:hypothetical protein
MNESLELRLHAEGFAYRAEVRDRLVILVPRETADLSREDRLRVTRIALAEGFTHVAVELDPEGAALPRD